MFKFNFSSENNVESSSFNDSNNDIEWLPSQCLTIDGDYKIDEGNLHTYVCGQFSIRYHDINATIHRATDKLNSIAIAEQNQSDLLPGKYEGGLKIWECTYDLAEYIASEFDSTSLAGSKVLDLGCGAGLLGILALQLGASVTFQDYNKEVLETTTIPNVLANLSTEYKNKLLNTQEIPEKKLCLFYSGDWGSFIECHQTNSSPSDGLFDYILTSETIYNPVNHKKLSSLFKRCLKRSGSVYLAAKTHYFGVGGGTRQFENVVASDGGMSTNVCWKSEGGLLVEQSTDDATPDNLQLMKISCFVLNPLGNFIVFSRLTFTIGGNKHGNAQPDTKWGIPYYFHCDITRLLFIL